MGRCQDDTEKSAPYNKVAVGARAILLKAFPNKNEQHLEESHSMKKTLSGLMAVLIILCLVGFSADAKTKHRKWNLSITNGYTFYNLKDKNSAAASTDLSGYDGQMNKFFSSLEISRNFGYYELGGKLQLFDYTFISPFLKINFRRNHWRARIIPSLTLGVVPSSLWGAYGRASLSWFANPYLSFRPFIGVYGWYRGKPHGHYIKSNIHINTGFTVTMYF